MENLSLSLIAQANIHELSLIPPIVIAEAAILGAADEAHLNSNIFFPALIRSANLISRVANLISRVARFCFDACATLLDRLDTTTAPLPQNPPAPARVAPEPLLPIIYPVQSNVITEARRRFSHLFADVLQEMKRELIQLTDTDGNQIHTQDDIESMFGSSYLAMLDHAILRIAERLIVEKDNQVSLISKNEQVVLTSSNTIGGDLCLGFIILYNCISAADFTPEDSKILKNTLNHKEEKLTSLPMNQRIRAAQNAIMNIRSLVEKKILNTVDQTRPPVNWGSVFSS